MKTVAVLSLLAVSGLLMQDQKPTVKIPDAGVPQIGSIEGTYVRAAYNNEGYVILGYRAANGSVGDEWMLLDTGMTVRDRTPSYKLKRDAISLSTPDGASVPLPSIEEYRTADLRALQNRSRTMRDSINYFPPTASRACRIGFFSNVESSAVAWDQVELDKNRGCVGELYFKIPGGIKYGQHFLNVKFADSLIRVPFRILTKDEEKMLDKHYKSIRQQVKDAFAPPKKGG
jgi:hypothetical protein